MTVKQLRELIAFLEFVPADCTIALAGPRAVVVTPSGDQPWVWELEWLNDKWCRL